ncbi:GntR family transcriptional regulator [Nonomuraea angiospora]|uniref:DNA-binding GntR family transcriptional regulator n=1 Tax=Nonomuraea angiospora TaxID=46172 RepID=A0ABR9MEN2_9ACTN|nr:GntR family transcriptional regulator [Nonomuraea angiospora]MBE1591254.1 DNA-binding GntR family transcriptional regulator [Nonomuraea angiospora]MDX3104355.1 GntR family transcriptional regulator [Nonomuraea angiospora]
MLDREGPVPIYKQVADLVRDQIERGELKAGDPVPSEATLEKDYDIARTTARRVARELREQGLAHTIQGEGTFVGRPGTPRSPRKVPLYQQISTEVSARIVQGEISPNRAIPGEKVMMRQYGVAKVTVRQAVAHLREQGWVFTVPYRGTFVNEPEKWPRNRDS